MVAPAIVEDVEPDATLQVPDSPAVLEMLEQVLPGAPLERVKTRGYYKNPVTGERYTSVTTLLNRSLAKNGLVYWSAERVANAAMAELGYLLKASRDEAEAEKAVKWLASAAEREKQAAADRGSAIHNWIEAYVVGTPIPEQLEPDPEVAACVKQFLRFVDEWDVEFTASEVVVANDTYGYGGTLDNLFKSRKIARKLRVSPSLNIAMDTKSGKNIYSDAALQLTAYRRADWAQTRSGLRVPMPKIATRGIVLHLRPEGYEAVPVDLGPRTFRSFLRLLAHDRGWSTDHSKHVFGDALVLDEDGEH